MVPALKVKSICFQCKVNHWAANFGKNSVHDLSSLSICLFCKIGKNNVLNKNNTDRIEACEKQVAGIREDQEKIVKQLKEIKGLYDRLSTSQTESIKVPTSIDFDLEEVKNKVVIVEQDLQLLNNKVDNNHEEYKVVSGKKSKHITACKTRVVQDDIKLTNRFNLLKDEGETILIGSSIVRDQGRHFCLKNVKSRTNICYPGATINRINDNINKMTIKSRKSRIITEIGTNDVYSFDRNVRNYETVISNFENLTNTLKSKTDNAVVVGILPRLNESTFHLNQAKAVNSKVKIICERKGINYVNCWDQFTDQCLFAKDGIHLNNVGKSKFGTILSENILRFLNDEVKVPVATIVPPRNETVISAGCSELFVRLPPKANMLNSPASEKSSGNSDRMRLRNTK